MTVIKKEPYKVRAEPKSKSKEELVKTAIRDDKGIPFKSPNGKIWLLYINDDGGLVIEERT